MTWCSFCENGGHVFWSQNAKYDCWLLRHAEEWNVSFDSLFNERVDYWTELLIVFHSRFWVASTNNKMLCMTGIYQQQNHMQKIYQNYIKKLVNTYQKMWPIKSSTYFPIYCKQHTDMSQFQMVPYKEVLVWSKNLKNLSAPGHHFG